MSPDATMAPMCTKGPSVRANVRISVSIRMRVRVKVDAQGESSADNLGDDEVSA